ncbi:MAG: DUF2723 domain-containing protein [Myxococcales bacterium]|nr:DUF2723 domain-containing protein [Myxococcales bacterium]
METAPTRTSAALWLGLGCGTLYAATAATTVQGNDAGEFVAAAASWGVPHPPGFATYAALTALIAHLSPLPDAHDLALVSGVCGGAAGAVLYALLRRLAIPATAATGAVLLWAIAPTTWAAHTGQEVFAAAHLAHALVLWRALVLWQQPSVPAAAILGVSCGLAVGVHTTVVFCAPLVALAALGLRVGRWPRLVVLVAGTALGLASQLYLLWAGRAGHGLQWGAVVDLPSLAHHLLRSDYGVLRLTLEQGGAPLGAVSEWLVAFAVGGLGLSLVAWLAGWGRLRRPVDTADARTWRALTLCHIVAGPVFLLLFQTPADDWWREHTARFFPLVGLYALPFVGVGLGVIEQWTALRSRPLAVAVRAWPALAAVAAVPFGPGVGRRAIEDFTDAVLASVPRGGLVLASEDATAAACWEAQTARGVRPDLQCVATGLLPAPWFSRALARRLAGYHHPERMAGTRLLTAWALEHERAVCYLDPPAAGLRRHFRFAHDGLCIRALPPGAPLPTLDQIEAKLVAMPAAPVGRFDWQAPRASESVVERRRQLPWLALCAARGTARDSAGLARCAERVARLH